MACRQAALGHQHAQRWPKLLVVDMFCSNVFLGYQGFRITFYFYGWGDIIQNGRRDVLKSCVTSHAWGRFSIKLASYQYMDSHYKIRLSRDRHIFMRGIPILVRRCLYTESAHWLLAKRPISQAMMAILTKCDALLTISLTCINLEPSDGT